MRLFQNRTSNLGLVTQTMQWLVLRARSFVVSVFLQQARGYSAIGTGLTLVPGHDRHPGVLGGGAADGQPAPPAPAGPAGFCATVVGLGLLLALSAARLAGWTFWPGLFLMGFGVGAMLTASVNVVQSRVAGGGPGRHLRGLAQRVQPRARRWVWRSPARSSSAPAGNGPYATAIVVVGAFALVGWVAALLLPRSPHP